MLNVQSFRHPLQGLKGMLYHHVNFMEVSTGLRRQHNFRECTFMSKEKMKREILMRIHHFIAVSL